MSTDRFNGMTTQQIKDKKYDDQLIAECFLATLIRLHLVMERFLKQGKCNHRFQDQRDAWTNIPWLNKDICAVCCDERPAQYYGDTESKVTENKTEHSNESIEEFQVNSTT